jgi:hypothetical protein
VVGLTPRTAQAHDPLEPRAVGIRQLVGLVKVVEQLVEKR